MEININNLSSRSEINADNITPRQAIKIAESHPTLTPKEREKTLALAIFYLVLEEPENFSRPSKGACIYILYEQSRCVARSLGYEIPNLDAHRMIDLFKNPAAFAEYR